MADCPVTAERCVFNWGQLSLLYSLRTAHFKRQGPASSSFMSSECILTHLHEILPQTNNGACSRTVISLWKSAWFLTDGRGPVSGSLCRGKQPGGTDLNSI